MLNKQSIVFIAVFLLTAAFLLMVNSVVQEQDIQDMWLAGGIFVLSVVFWVWLFTEQRSDVRALTSSEEADMLPKAKEQVIPEETAASPAKAQTAAKPKPAAKPQADEEDTDDLERIEGIGPKYRDALVEAGYTRFAEIAQATTEDLEAIIKEAGMRRPGSINTWVEQASLAASDEWEALDKLQEELSGGRRS